ncbi:MAG: nitroreductase family protein [archaeon]
METLECIKSRRSVRKFLDKEVSDKILKELIAAAIQAPFGGGPDKGQLWEFVIVKDQAIKQKLVLEYKDRQFLIKAPVVIAVCADKEKDAKYKNWDITSALAVENLLLAAHALGLGACYVDTFNHHEGHKEDREKLNKALGLPGHIELIAIMPLGYSDPSEDFKEKKLKAIGEMLHFDKW